MYKQETFVNHHKITNASNCFRGEKTMSFKIDYNDLIKILKAFGEDDDTAKIIADYLDECITFEFDLSHYLWNTLQFNVHCFDTKEEALQYVQDDGTEDYTLYECTGNIGVYLETH